ncbi:DUF4435 domain-containing protein [Streptococcus suis]|uniref:DUF4435 domain-containing protein n=1 Tax=Streptococcus suis TaxID=1307 RepID=UPI000C18C90A|nr:DUF4435 domain-containing protein [Streptococcus suis]
MSAELSYSQEGLRNRSIFYKQDINIFVEDTDKEYLYEEILNRLLNDKYKIETVFPLGGKNKVLSEYIKQGEVSKSGIPNLFLVDGDFDRYLDYSSVTRNDYQGSREFAQQVSLFVNDKIIESDSVLYLEAYNIENYFIDENAIIKFIKGIMQKKDSELKSILDFGSWRDRIVSESKDLFIIYCFIAKYLHLYGGEVDEHISKLSIPTVSRSPFEFLDPKTGFKRNTNVYEEFKEKIKQDLAMENPDIDLDVELSKIIEQYQNINGEDYYNLICGKFLFSSIGKYIETICEKSIDFKQFQWHMILNFDITKLSYVKERIDRLCRADRV